MYNTIFFDFNGTIIDDVDLCLNILNEMLNENGKPSITKERYKEIFQFPISKYYELAGFDFNERSFEDLSVDFINKYQKASLKCNLYPNAVDVFKNLHNRGYRLVILSASQIDNLLEQVRHFKIEGYFDAVLGINDIYARSKKDIGLDYLRKNNIESKGVIMIGDTLHDKEVADAMGIDCVLFSSGHQSTSILARAGVGIVDSYKEFERHLVENDKTN